MRLPDLGATATFVHGVERTRPAGRVRIDAVILTKVDTDAKGGAALSIAKAVGKPILFLGVGQEYADMVPYDPQWMVDRIFEAA